MLKKQITDSLVESVHHSLWGSAVKEYGQATMVPREIAYEIGETVRSLYVLQVWAKEGCSGNPVRFLRSYGVADKFINSVVEEYCRVSSIKEVKEASRPEKRADKYAKLEKFALENLYKEFETEQLVELSGLSYPTVLKWLKVSGYYRQIKRGLWEARNPKDDRESEKN